MYLVHEVFHCRRGKVPEVLEILKLVNKSMTDSGLVRNGRIYADFSDRMDTLVYDCETDSMDQYYKTERSNYVDPSPQFMQLIDQVNDNTVMGSRTIYEIIV